MDIYSLVATYPTEFEAKLAESILSEAGIPSFVQSPDVYPPLDYTRGIKVMVHPENADAAKQLLSDIEQNPEASELRSETNRSAESN